MKILITGGAGFIGSNFVRLMLKEYPDIEIVVLDKLTYAGRLENLKDVVEKIEFVKGDICDKEAVEKTMNGCDTVFNFAAETHVDRSIVDAGLFVQTDVFGTYRLLEAARKFGVDRFLQISTDEVYGNVMNGSSKETDALNPSSPYSASKGGADLLVNSYFITYGLNAVITRSSNNYGPFQHPEKLIPKLIINSILGRQLPIYGDGTNVRDWVHVLDNCKAIDIISKKGKSGEVYNVASNDERKNIDVAKLVLKYMDKPENLIEFVKDRMGHDKRYSLHCEKIKKLGWQPSVEFETGIKDVIDWFIKNEWWWKPLVS